MKYQNNIKKYQIKYQNNIKKISSYQIYIKGVFEVEQFSVL